MKRTLQDITNEAAENILQECLKAGLDGSSAVASGAWAVIILISATTQPRGYQATARIVARLIREALAERAKDAKRDSP